MRQTTLFILSSSLITFTNASSLHQLLSNFVLSKVFPASLTFLCFYLPGHRIYMYYRWCHFKSDPFFFINVSFTYFLYLCRTWSSNMSSIPVHFASHADLIELIGTLSSKWRSDAKRLLKEVQSPKKKRLGGGIKRGKKRSKNDIEPGMRKRKNEKEEINAGK